ncbi:MAG: AEC family transporter [Gammaproteobacteria bacterium]|nr:AEC family transporter [Gammaproteobacteria bacterium]
MFLQVLSIILPVAVVVLVGYLYASRRSVDFEAANRINVDVFFPALIFSALSTQDYDLSDVKLLAGGAVAVVLGSGLLAYPIARIFKFDWRVFLPPMMFNNCGNLGLPIAVFAFGEHALTAAVILMITSNLLNYTLGVRMMANHVGLWDVLRVPMVIASFGGLAAGLLQWRPAPLIAVPIEMLGQIAIPLVLFSLGARLKDVKITNWQISVTGAVVCPLVGVGAALVYASVVDLEAEYFSQLLVFAALPPAVMNYLIAERYKQQPEALASMVMVGNLFALISLPIVLVFALNNLSTGI